MNHLLPNNCETCLAECIERTISSRFSNTESTEYKCGARYHQYASHRSKSITQACPQSPAEKRKVARHEEIDRAVATALNKVNASYKECEEFPKRMERDKGWRLRADAGVWTFVRAKRPREEDSE